MIGLNRKTWIILANHQLGRRLRTFGKKAWSKIKKEIPNQLAPPFLYICDKKEAAEDIDKSSGFKAQHPDHETSPEEEKELSKNVPCCSAMWWPSVDRDEVVFSYGGVIIPLPCLDDPLDL